jgi:hypothetical protein
MPDPRRKRCVVCGRREDEVGPLSWTGKCAEDSIRILAENVYGISTKTGPAHRRRLRGIARYLERALLDDPRTNP